MFEHSKHANFWTRRCLNECSIQKSAPTFECRSSTEPHRGKPFSGCRGANKYATLFHRDLIFSTIIWIKNKVIFLQNLLSKNIQFKNSTNFSVNFLYSNASLFVDVNCCIIIQVYNLFQNLWNWFNNKGDEVGVQSPLDTTSVQTVMKGILSMYCSYRSLDHTITYG